LHEEIRQVSCAPISRLCIKNFSYVEGHIISVDDHTVTVMDITERKHTLHQPWAKIRFRIGQVLHARVRMEEGGHMAIDAIV